MSICEQFPLLMKYITEYPFFCMAPFASVTTSVDGDYSFCCISKDCNFRISDCSFEEYFNSSILKNIHREMTSTDIGDVTKEYCHKCLVHERAGSTSRRQTMNDTLVSHMKNRNNWSWLNKVELTLRNVEQDTYPLNVGDMGFGLLDFKIFGNLCNLACIMCHPDSSNQIAKEQIQLGTYTGPENYNPYADLSPQNRDRFYRELDVILPNTHTIRFTGGEPTINKSILEMVEWIVSRGYNKNLDIHITTNGMIVSEQLLNYLLQFRSINVSISLDGCWEINELQRRGSKFSTIDKNISTYAQYSKIGLYFVPTVTSFNCSRLIELQNYSMYKLKKDIHLGFCLKPKQFSILHLPDDIRTKYISLFEKSQYAELFRCVIALLKSGQYDKDIFQSYLDRIFSLYGKERMLKYFPEYKPYALY